MCLLGVNSFSFTEKTHSWNRTDLPRRRRQMTSDTTHPPTRLRSSRDEPVSCPVRLTLSIVGESILRWPHRCLSGLITSSLVSFGICQLFSLEIRRVRFLFFLRQCRWCWHAGLENERNVSKDYANHFSDESLRAMGKRTEITFLFRFSSITGIEPRLTSDDESLDDGVGRRISLETTTTRAKQWKRELGQTSSLVSS